MCSLRHNGSRLQCHSETGKLWHVLHSAMCPIKKKKNTQGYKVKFRKSFLNLPSHKGWGESALSNKLHSVSCKVQIVKEDPDPQKLLEVSHWQQHAPGFIWPLRVALGVCVVFSAMRNSQPSHRVLTHLEQGHYMHQAVWLSLPQKSSEMF